MANPDRGEVWLVDLGLVAKIRPCLVLSVPSGRRTNECSVTMVPHTTNVRGSRYEVRTPFHSSSLARLMHRT